MLIDSPKYAQKHDKHLNRLPFITLAVLFIASGSAFADPLLIKVPAWSTDGQSQLSLSQALLMARDVRKNSQKIGQVIIELSGGIHRLSNTVEIMEKDSGTFDEPLIIRAAPGMSVRLLGSRPVFLGDAQYLSDTFKEYWEALPPIARGKVRVFDLDQDQLAGVERQQLTFQQRIAPVNVSQNARPFIMARWPNDGFDRSQGVTTAATKKMGPQFSVPLDKAVAWSREHDLWAGGYWGWNWHFETAPVSAVDAQRGLVTLFPLKASYPVRPGLRYFIYNALSELDTLGEYVVDWRARRIIIWPYDDDLSTNPIEISSVQRLLGIHGAKHLRIEGIAFENARGDAIQISDSVDVEIADCLVGNVGGNGILVERGRDVRIVRSVIRDTGEAGVVLSGGDRKTLVPAGHAVRNSVLVRFGHFARTNRPGVELFGVGQIIEGSYFSYAPHSAIMFHGNDHRIIGNEIERVVQETSDAGAIYA